MELLTAATAFATIISLVADFRSQRTGEERADYDEFVSWLSDGRHEEALSLLQQNANTAVGIKAMLGQDRQTLLARLDGLDRSLAALASSVEGVSLLAAAIRPDSILSHAALSFLRQFETSGASKVVELQYDQTTEFLPLDGGPSFQFPDQRFMEDDLMTLIETGILRLQHNGKGERIFVFTRYAADLVRSASV